MPQYTKVDHCCGTCNYWHGQRRPDFSRHYAIVESAGSIGRCLRSRSEHHGSGMMANTPCENWLAWGVLK
ncbi:MAG: hypothetical protein QM639_10930 [Rhodocyclaceae bacterium]